MLFIGIDVGASFIKGAVLNTESSSIEHVLRVPFPEFIPDLPPLHCEVDTKSIMKSVNTILEQLLSLAPTCAGIVVCGQMGGIVLTNSLGESISNYISWQDQRALKYLNILENRITSIESKHLGNEFKHNLPIATLLWLSEKKMLHGIPTSLPDFIVANLCGCSPITEATNAEAYGIYNIYSHDWDYGICLKLGLRGLLLPSLRQVGEIVGRFDGIPCYVAIGDQQCALLGALLKENELSLNISTGCQVSIISKLEYGDYQIRPYFGKYMKTVTHIPAGRLLNALIKSCNLSWDEVIERIDFREIIESISDNCYQAALRISPEKEWTNLVLSGGLANKIGILRQMIQQKFSIDYRIATAEDTLNGLLIMAQKTGGVNE